MSNDKCHLCHSVTMQIKLVKIQNRHRHSVTTANRLRRIFVMDPTGESSEVRIFLGNAMAKIEDTCRVANLQTPIQPSDDLMAPSSPVGLEDPVVFPKIGRRREARIQSSLEKRKRISGPSQAVKQKGTGQ